MADSVKLVQWRTAEPETILEMAAVLFAVSCLGALGALVFGRAASVAQRARRHARNLPTRGTVPAERHQHTGAVSAR
jgi:hypothetical protein